MSTPQGGVDFIPAVSQIPADVPLLTEAGVSWPPGTTTYSAIEVTAPSYLITGWLQIPSAATVPLAQITLYWQDPVNAIYTDKENWTLACVTNAEAAGAPLFTGRGPTRSGQLTITVDNLDPVQTITGYLYFYQSSRVITRADWRAFWNGLTVPGYTLAAADPAALVLGAEAGAAAAVGTTSWMLSLYAGEAGLSFTQTAAQNLSLKIITLDPVTGISGEPCWVAPLSTDVYASTATLPRAVCLFEVVNGGSETTDVTWMLTAQEVAS